MEIFVGWPAEQRNVIPPSLIGEYSDCSCSRCGADLVCHEPTRKQHWDGWEVVCPDCAVEAIDEHDGPTDVRQERDAAFERHWRRG